MSFEGHTIFQKYESIKRSFNDSISSIKTPIGHGTTREHLDSILKTGLGTNLAENAYSGTNSATDLRKDDGLLGAYAFAKMNTEDLEIEGEDVIARYCRLNPLIEEDQLRQKFSEYKEKRNPQGFPVLLIYEGGSIDLNYANPRIPSEIELKEPLKDNHPKIILVPNNYVLETQTLLSDMGIECDVFPIETLEID